jgi:hypothetical protein
MYNKYYAFLIIVFVVLSIKTNIANAQSNQIQNIVSLDTFVNIKSDFGYIGNIRRNCKTRTKKDINITAFFNENSNEKAMQFVILNLITLKKKAFSIDFSKLTKKGVWFSLYDFDFSGDTIVISTGNALFSITSIFANPKLCQISVIQNHIGFDRLRLTSNYLFGFRSYLYTHGNLSKFNFSIFKLDRWTFEILDTLVLPQKNLELSYFSPFSPMDGNDFNLVVVDPSSLELKTFDLNFKLQFSFNLAPKNWISALSDSIQYLTKSIPANGAADKIFKLSNYFDKIISKFHEINLTESNDFVILYDIKDTFSKKAINFITIGTISDSGALEIENSYSDLLSGNKNNNLVFKGDYPLACYNYLHTISARYFVILKNERPSLDFPYDKNKRILENEEYYKKNYPEPILFIYKVRY